jgi:GNAT superfamily N-acetyltransferase
MVTYKYEIDIKVGGYIYQVNFYNEGKYIGFVDLSVNLNEMNVVQLGYLEILPKFRGKGYGKQAYVALSELYHDQFEGKIIARKFINPIAEKLAKEALEKGLFPKESWDDKYVTRDFLWKKGRDKVES